MISADNIEVFSENYDAPAALLDVSPEHHEVLDKNHNVPDENLVERGRNHEETAGNIVEGGGNAVVFGGFQTTNGDCRDITVPLGQVDAGCIG